MDATYGFFDWSGSRSVSSQWQALSVSSSSDVAALSADLTNRSQDEGIDLVRVAATLGHRLNQPTDQFLWLERCQSPVRPRLSARCPHRIVNPHIQE